MFLLMFSDVIWIASLENKAHVKEAKNGKDSPKKDVVYETGSENSKTKQIEPCQPVI